MTAKESSEPPEKRRKGLPKKLNRIIRKLSGESGPGKVTEATSSGARQKESERVVLPLDLQPEEKRMIMGVLDISSMAVKEIMVPRVDMVGVECGTPVEEVVRLVREAGHSRLPLYEGSLDNIVGIIYVKDLFVKLLAPDKTIHHSDARPPFFVPENKLISELLRDMRARKIHLAIVVDEYGGTAGLVTLEDILEVIVGEIEDEYDRFSWQIKKIDERRYTLKGSLSLHELNQLLGLALPEDKFETVAGVIYDLVGGLPKPGTKVTYQNLTFVAEKIAGQRITEVIVELPTGGETDTLAAP